MVSIKLLAAGTLVLISACSESNDRKAAPKESGQAVNFAAPYSNRLTALTPGTFVAGLAPSRRPEGAPAIREFAPGDTWRSRFMTGIVEPIPAGLDFVDSQGAWYTPFNQPGMPGVYDLRNWYQGAR